MRCHRVVPKAGRCAVLVPGAWAGIAQFTLVGEVVLIFWLLIKGRRITVIPEYQPDR